MKLYAISTAAETDWVAAEDEQQARTTYMIAYDLSDRDMDGVEIYLVELPQAVMVYLDEVDAETGERATAGADEVMASMKRPGIVCSTCQ